MRRLLGWLGGMAGGIALYRLFERRATAVAELEPAAPDPRAEELRARLEHEDEPEAPAAPEPEPQVQAEAQTQAEAPEPVDESDPEARRRRVHEEGRAAVHRMRGSR